MKGKKDDANAKASSFFYKYLNAFKLDIYTITWYYLTCRKLKGRFKFSHSFITNGQVRFTCPGNNGIVTVPLQS